MSRVKSVVGNSIMVSIYDVVPGDILYTMGREGDPIIEKVETVDNLVRFFYKNDHRTPVEHSNWMSDGPNSGHVFLHDLKGERFEADAPQDKMHKFYVEAVVPKVYET